MPLPHFLRQPVQPQQLQPVEVDPTLIPVQQAPVPTEPQTSFFGRLAGNTLSGLAAVGNFLDVPGSMVRDTLTLRNPLDQLLTPFSDANRTTGRQMLADYGLTTENDPNRWELADFAGFGAELGADPFFWPAKWLKPVGMAADAAKGASVGGELLRAGYRATPEAVQQGVTRATEPASTFLKGLFSYRHGGQFTKEGQAAKSAMVDAEEALAPYMQADRSTTSREFQSAADLFDETVRQDALQQLRDQPIDIDPATVRERANQIYNSEEQQFLRESAEQLRQDEGWAEIRRQRDRGRTGNLASQVEAAERAGLDHNSIEGFDMWADELRMSYPIFQDRTNEDLFEELLGRTDDPPLFRQAMEQAERELTDEIAGSRMRGGDQFELEAGRAINIRNPRLARIIEDTSRLTEGLDEYPEMTTGFLARIGTRSSKVLVKKTDPFGKAADQLRYVEVPNEQLFRNDVGFVQYQQAENFFNKFQSDVARFGGEVVDNPDAYTESFMKFGDLNVRQTSEEFAQRNANVIQALRDITEMRPVFPENGYRDQFANMVRETALEGELLSDDIIDKSMSVWEATARHWGEKTGQDPDEFFRQWGPSEVQTMNSADFVAGPGTLQQSGIGGQGLDIRTVEHAGHPSGAVEIWGDKDLPIGEVALNTQTPHQENMIREMFNVPDSESVTRMGGIWLDESLRNQGVGKRLYLEMADKVDGWIWNNQSSDDAIRTLDSLERDGLLEVKWNRPQDRVRDQHRIMRITEKGREALGAAKNDVLFQGGKGRNHPVFKELKRFGELDNVNDDAADTAQRYIDEWQANLKNLDKPGMPEEMTDPLTGERISWEDFAEADAVKKVFGSYEARDEFAKSVGGDDFFDVFFQQGNTTGARGAVEFLEDGRNIMYLFENADASTFMHESAHIFRRAMSTADQELATRMDEAITSLLPEGQRLTDNTGRWTREAEEVFASGFETYLKEGKAPNAGLKKAFESFKQWITDIYRRLTGQNQQPININDELRAVFDDMLSTTDPIIDTKMAGSKVSAIKDSRNARVEYLGGRTGTHSVEAGSKTNHWPRYVPRKIAEELQKSGFGPNEFQTAFDSMKMRRADIRNLPTATVEELLSNRRYRGPRSEQRILEDFGDQLDETFGMPRDAEVAAPEDSLFDPAFDDMPTEVTGEGLEAHAASLAEFVKQHNRGTLYQHTLKADMDRYIRGMYRVEAGLTGLHNYLSSRAALNAGDATIPLSQIYDNLNLNTDQIRNYYQKELGMNLDELRVSREVASTAKNARSMLNPQRLDGPIAQAIDKFNRWFKSGVTLPFPAFHARNFLSGQVVNFMFNDTNPKEYLASFNEAIDIARNVDNLTDEQLRFVEEAYTHGVVDEGYVGFGLDDTIHPHNEHIPEASRLIPGINPLQSRADAAREVSAAGVPSWINQLANRSPRAAEYANRYTEPLRVLGQQVMGTGGNAGRVAEYFNRMPLYITLRKQGMDAAEAAAKVEKLHFNYAKLTPFEKDVAKRAIPFWTFSRKMSELVVDDLIKNPGGKLAQTIRATRLSQQDDPATPEYVSQTTAIPFGKLEDGTASYLTGFGMAHEDPLSFIGADRESGMLSPQSSILELLSRTSPLIKAPIELATGESFFQKGPMGGRELIDMDPTLGRLASNVSEWAGQGPIEDAAGRAYPVGGNFVEHLVANSPYARFASTARAVTDPRKYEGGPFPGSKALLNTFTGLRVSDVSPEAQQAVIRERVSAYARENMGAKMYQKVYFSKEQIANTEQENPELASQMKLINRMQQLFKKKKEEKVESNPE